MSDHDKAIEDATSRLAGELKDRGIMTKDSTTGNLPTDAEFTGDKVPEEGRPEKNELSAWEGMEQQSVKDRKADQEEHEMGSPILASQEEARTKISSLLNRIEPLQPKLKKAVEEGAEMFEALPDEDEFPAEEFEETGEELEGEEVIEEGEEEESEYEDLTPKETLEYAVMDVQEAIDALDIIQDQLVEASRRLHPSVRYSSGLQELLQGLVTRAEGTILEGQKSLNHFRDVTREVPVVKPPRVEEPISAITDPEDVIPEPSISPAAVLPGAPTPARASLSIEGIVKQAESLLVGADKLRSIATGEEDEPDEEDKAAKKKKEDTTKESAMSKSISKKGAAYPPTDAQFTGDKQISPVPQEKELSHWHEGDARGDRDKSTEERYDLNNIGDRIELYERIKTLTADLRRSKESALESMWSIRDGNTHLGNITFADVVRVEDKENGGYDRENYATFLSDDYGEELKYAVMMHGPEALQNGFASLTEEQLTQIETLASEVRQSKFADLEGAKEAALNIIRAFESPEVPDKGKLIAYFTDAYGDAEYARKLVNALLARREKLAKAIQVGLQYKAAYESVTKQSSRKVRARRALDVANTMKDKGLITEAGVKDKAIEIAKYTDEQFEAVAGLFGLAAPDEDFERHMQDAATAGIVGNPLEGVRNPKAKADTEDLQPEVKSDAKLSSLDVSEADIEAVASEGEQEIAGVAPQLVKEAKETQSIVFGPDLSFTQRLWSTTPNRLRWAGLKNDRWNVGPHIRRG